jgi:hypothetical protein
MTYEEVPQDPQERARGAARAVDGTRFELPLRRLAKALPAAAAGMTVMWGYTVAAVLSGPGGAFSAALMSVLGLLLLFVAVTYVGYAVRPLSIAVGPRGFSVRLPLLAERTMPWEDLAAVRAVGVAGAQFLVVEPKESRETLPYLCHPRASYRRLALMTGDTKRGRKGICFERMVFELVPEDVLGAVRGWAPEEVRVEDRRR